MGRVLFCYWFSVLPVLYYKSEAYNRDPYVENVEESYGVE